MRRLQLIQAILEASLERQPFEHLDRTLQGISRDNLSMTLLECGIIPESFGHDSSQEKPWAKACDILLAHALGHLGIPCVVIRTRGNSADVLGTTADYSIVGDAKAFRLSRTAKNQKDFKVKALDDWRRANTFACLVAPLNQFPVENSQIYTQCKERNVTLLSYTHVRFLIEKQIVLTPRTLWETPKGLEITDQAVPYWAAIDAATIAITSCDDRELREYKNSELNRIREVGEEGIAHWENVKRTYANLTREEAIAKLIRAEKIDAKIAVIRRAIDRQPVL